MWFDTGGAAAVFVARFALGRTHEDPSQMEEAKSPQRSMLAPVVGFLSRLRYRSLFLIAAALLAVDLVVPDAIPFADEILLAIVTIVLARLRKPGDGSMESP